GVVASSYASKTEKVKGVILLASYSTKSLSNKEVLSIYGTNDGILDKKAYDKNKNNLPNNYTEYVIDGANHSQFGLYGLQKKDKEASISFDTQLYITVNKMIDFVNKDDNKD
nr:alpha/beta hydrolase [bacterium]